LFARLLVYVLVIRLVVSEVGEVVRASVDSSVGGFVA